MVTNLVGDDICLGKIAGGSRAGLSTHDKNPGRYTLSDHPDNKKDPLPTGQTRMRSPLRQKTGPVLVEIDPTLSLKMTSQVSSVSARTTDTKSADSLSAADNGAEGVNPSREPPLSPMIALRRVTGSAPISRPITTITRIPIIAADCPPAYSSVPVDLRHCHSVALLSIAYVSLPQHALVT